MRLEGDHSVLDAIKEKKRLMDAGGSHEHIKPLLIVGGGLMKGAYGVGAACAFDDMGYSDVFYAAGGVSCGAATIAYMLTKQTETGKRVTYEDCCTKEFFSKFRWPDSLDTKVYQRALEGATGKRLDAEALLAHPTPFRIGLSRYKDGAPVLLAPENEEEVYVGMRASASMPGVVSEPIYVRGERYVDGSSSHPQVIESIWNEFADATHVLLITNQDKSTKRISLIERILLHTLYRSRLTKKLLYAASHRRMHRHQFVQEKLKQEDKPLLVVWGDNSIKSYERSGEVVSRVIEKSRGWWKQQLQ